MRRSLKECLWRNHSEECANWSISEFQMKKQSPKLESMRKTKQNRQFWKFWLLVNSQCIKSKSKVNGQSKSMARQKCIGQCDPSRIWVSGSILVWVTNRVVILIMSSDDVLPTCSRACLACLYGCWRGLSDVIEWHHEDVYRNLSARMAHARPRRHV